MAQDFVARAVSAIHLANEWEIVTALGWMNMRREYDQRQVRNFFQVTPELRTASLAEADGPPILCGTRLLGGIETHDRPISL